MSKTWYPIIDYDKCSGCLACYDKCTHGVYELNSKNFPKVIFPEGCVHGCRGCGSLCPQEAIAYLGDGEDIKSGDCCGEKDSGCCSEEKEEKAGGCGCGCGCC